MLKVVRAKLHAIRVTGADLNYHGSITLDPEHCTEAGIYPLEFVEIWNKHSGRASRLTSSTASLARAAAFSTGRRPGPARLETR